MSKRLSKIVSFVQEHHVLSLATKSVEELSVCSLFYVYDEDSRCFIVASSEDTLHMKHIRKDPNVAGNILLETESIGRIQGLQFRGKFVILQEEKLKILYFKEVNFLKLTDNRLGFGKKNYLD